MMQIQKWLQKISKKNNLILEPAWANKEMGSMNK